MQVWAYIKILRSRFYFCAAGRISDAAILVAQSTNKSVAPTVESLKDVSNKASESSVPRAQSISRAASAAVSSAANVFTKAK